MRTRKRELTLGIRVQPHDTSTVRVSVDGGAPLFVNNHHVFQHTRNVRVLFADFAAERTVRVTHARGPRFRIDYVLYAGEPETP